MQKDTLLLLSMTGNLGTTNQQSSVILNDSEESHSHPCSPLEGTEAQSKQRASSPLGVIGVILLIAHCNLSIMRLSL